MKFPAKTRDVGSTLMTEVFVLLRKKGQLTRLYQGDRWRD